MLLYGIAGVAALWLLLSNCVQANPATFAKLVRAAGSIVALGATGLLALRGRIDLALLTGVAGAWLLGWSRLTLPHLGRRAPPSPGSVSRVRSSLIEMTLDHDTGALDGTVLTGAFAGRALADLDEAGLRDLLAECHAGDPDGVRLLEAYLDRRFSHWRGDAQDGGQPRSGGEPASGAMTPEEAYRILDLGPGVTPDEIRQAHRTLMKKLHPDQGGSTYLAARVNQAKDVLLGRPQG